MYSDDAVLEFMQFLKTTPEGNLLKMLKDKDMTEAHIRFMVKLAKTTKDVDFVKSFHDEMVPNIRMSNGEHAIKEKFWSVCKKKLSSMGLLTETKGDAKAA